MVLLRMKVAFVGEPTSGKTAFAQMLHSGGVTFPKNYFMTVGADLTVKEVNLDLQTTVEISIFDIAGHSLYTKLVPSYLENLSAFVLIYDVSNKSTFDTCRRWIELCRGKSGNCIGFLIANKMDLADKCEVTELQGENFARTHNLKFFKASALRGVGINEPIEELARLHVENYNERCRQVAAGEKPK